MNGENLRYDPFYLLQHTRDLRCSNRVNFLYGEKIHSFSALTKGDEALPGWYNDVLRDIEGRIFFYISEFQENEKSTLLSRALFFEKIK